MSKTKWYAKPVYLLVALALVLSLGIMALPMAGTVEASSITWTEYAGNPVFAGTNRAYYPCVLAIDGIYHMWYTDKDGGGYQVGYTTSADGVNWSSPPTIVTGLTGTPNHVVVVNVGTEASPHYRIWYANAAVWPYNVDLLRTAESGDGLAWTNDQPIVQANNLIRENDSNDPAYQWVYGSYGPGAVLYNPDGYESLDEEDPMGNKYVMYYDQYTRYGLTGVNEVTMLAISTDGINWKRYGNTPVLEPTGGSTAWDAQYAYAWTVLKLSDGYHMWYSGGILDSNDGIGYAYSADGIIWAKDLNPVLHADEVGAPVWRQSRTYCPMVIKDGSSYKMWFSGVGSDYSIGYATAAPPTIEVDIDIKPGSDPNSINPKSKGVVPVAVLTTNDFDASDVDPCTVEFASADPLRWTMEDVDGDGDLDMLFHFKTQELNLDDNSPEATLTGTTYDGTSIQGTDTVNIVPKKGKK